MNNNVLNLAIGVPSLDVWQADFGLSLIDLIGYIRGNRIPGFDGLEYSIINKRSSILPKGREMIVEEAIKTKATHLLFLDSDQTFPPNLLHRLIAHKQKVVGCNIAQRGFPIEPTARRMNAANPLGDLVYSTNKEGLEPVWRLGLGIMLIDMSVFKLLYKPWFLFDQDLFRGWIGEDWYFCKKLEENKIDINVDHSTSKLIGHIGNYVYKLT